MRKESKRRLRNVLFSWAAAGLAAGFLTPLHPFDDWRWPQWLGVLLTIAAGLVVSMVYLSKDPD